MFAIEVKLNDAKTCDACRKPIKVNEKALAFGVPAENAWSGKKTFLISFYEHESCYLETQTIRVTR